MSFGIETSEPWKPGTSSSHFHPSSALPSQHPKESQGEWTKPLNCLGGPKQKVFDPNTILTLNLLMKDFCLHEPCLSDSSSHSKHQELLDWLDIVGCCLQLYLVHATGCNWHPDSPGRVHQWNGGKRCCSFCVFSICLLLFWVMAADKQRLRTQRAKQESACLPLYGIVYVAVQVEIHNTTIPSQIVNPDAG